MFERFKDLKTEELVEELVDKLINKTDSPIVDLPTGSGYHHTLGNKLSKLDETTTTNLVYGAMKHVLVDMKDVIHSSVLVSLLDLSSCQVDMVLKRELDLFQKVKFGNGYLLTYQEINKIITNFMDDEIWVRRSILLRYYTLHIINREYPNTPFELRLPHTYALVTARVLQFRKELVISCKALAITQGRRVVPNDIDNIFEGKIIGKKGIDNLNRFELFLLGLTYKYVANRIHHSLENNEDLDDVFDEFDTWLDHIQDLQSIPLETFQSILNMKRSYEPSDIIPE